MRKTAALGLAILLLALSGCQRPLPGDSAAPVIVSPATPQPSAPVSGSVAADYLPRGDHVLFVYQGQGNEFASYEVYNDFTAPDRVQQRTDNGGTVMVRVLAVLDGKLVRTFSAGEIYYRENLLYKEGEEEVLLAEPIVIGTSWTLADGRTRTIMDTEATLETPSGTYQNVVVVVTEGEEGTTIQYYAKGVGLIQTVYKTEEFEISSTLASVRQDAALTVPVRFYYPSAEDDKIYYVEQDVVFHTNDDTGAILAEAYRTEPFGLVPVLTENTAVNSLSLHDDGMVYLDLSMDFITEMNAGSGYEAMILQSLANTFAGYYGAEKLVLTVDGKPYASGHFEMKEGGFFTALPQNAFAR